MTPGPAVGLAHRKLEEIFDACIQNLASPHRAYRAAVHRFLAYLQTDFPQVLQLSELRRDPHLLGWLRRLCQQDPPLSSSTRRIYLVVPRRRLCDLASAGHPLQPGLIVAEDFSPQSRRYNSPSFDLVRFLTPVSRLSRPFCDPARRAAIAAWLVTSSPIFKPISRSCSTSPNFAATPICSACSAASTNKIHPCPPALAICTYS